MHAAIAVDEEFTKALKDGEVEHVGIDSILMGLGGAGKTCCLHRILNEDLPVRSSTSCTRAPVRTMITVDGDSKEMKRVEGDDYFSKVVEMVMAVSMNKADVKDMVHDEDGKDMVDKADGKDMVASADSKGVVENADSKGMDKDMKQTDGVDIIKTDGVDMNKTDDLDMIKVAGLVQNTPMSEVEKEMHQSAKKMDDDCRKKCERVLKLRWNRLTDSGGQSEFLEVLPIFIHNITVCIFIIKLNEKLDSFPMIPFYNEGKSVGEIKSTYSQEQIVRRFMRALISQHGAMENLRFLFIGTHRDLKEQCEESIEQKNTKLKGIIQSFNMDDQVHYYD